jgi:hypothetical protein
MPEVSPTYPPHLDAPTPERVELAHAVRELREAAGLSINRLTELAQYTKSERVGAIEKPDKPVPSRTLIAAVDIALRADRRLIDLWRRAYHAEVRRRELLKKVTTAGAAAIVLPPSALDEELEILERIIQEQVDYVNPGVVDELERLAAAALVVYETTHSAVLAPNLRQWNHRISKLLLGKQYPSELKRLQAVGCQLSGFLSQVSSDLGQHDEARLYGLESFTRAERQGNFDLCAWSRGMQSIAAYGAGDFAGAVDLARLPGQQAGDQTARLAFDEAKALAKMGDRKGVSNAVERGMAYSGTTERTIVNRSAVTIGSYPLAASSYHACCAYVIVGDADNAQKYAEYPLSASEQWEEDDPGRAFIRIELATALAESDPSQAGEFAMAALDYTAKHPVATIAPRIADFLTAARSPKVRNVPAIRNAVDATQTVLRQLGQKRV